MSKTEATRRKTTSLDEMLNRKSRPMKVKNPLFYIKRTFEILLSSSFLSLIIILIAQRLFTVHLDFQKMFSVASKNKSFSLEYFEVKANILEDNDGL